MFTGRQALELGLVDQIGSLEDAVRDAAKRARIKDFDLRSYPEPKNFLELFVEDMADGEHDPNHVSLAGPGFGASPARGWQQPFGRTSVLELALPHLKGLDPGRLETVKAALRRLDLIGQEHAVLLMPEMSIR